MTKDMSRAGAQAGKREAGFWSRLCRSGVLARFARNKRGNVAITFGLCAIPLVIGAGAAVDLSRALIVRQRLVHALDAAGLAVGKTMNLDQTQMTVLATKFFNANYPVSELGTPHLAAPVQNGNDIVLTATSQMPTAIMNIVGIDHMTIGATTTITRATKGLELSLVLDTTGSMADDTPAKIDSLKTASNQLLDILFGNSTLPDLLKVGIVPFSVAVRLDPQFAMDNGWLDSAGQSTWSHTNFTGDNQYGKTYTQDSAGKSAYWLYTDANGLGKIGGKTIWTGCVEARANKLDETDTAPTGGADSKWVPMFWPDEPHVNEPENSTYNPAAPNQTSISSNYGNDYISNLFTVGTTSVTFNQHLYNSFSSDSGFKVLTVTSAVPSTDLLTSSGHGLSTGDGPIRFGGSLPPGVLSGTNYWVRKNNTNTFYLATTQARANSSSGPFVDITGASTWSGTSYTNVLFTGTTAAKAHYLNTGDGPIRVSSTGSLPSGLATATDYWAIAMSSVNQFRLANSAAGATSASPGVAITTAGSGTQYTNAFYKSAHGLSTGDGPAQLTGTLPSGLSTGTNYWIRKVNTDVFQFATSLANATASTPTIVQPTSTTTSQGSLTIPKINITNDTMQSSSAHGLTSGAGPVRFQSTGTLPGGIVAGTDYWYSVVDSTTVKLATSRANAIAGTPVVDITSVGSGTVYGVESPGGTTLAEQTQRQNDWRKYVGQTYTGQNGPLKGCGMQPVTMPTNDKSVLQAAITALSPAGNTHVPLGLGWGWRLISGKLPGLDITPYSNDQYIKAVVLMTDGANTMNSQSSTLNASDYTAYGYAAQQRMGSGINTASEMATEIDASLGRTCNAIKALKDSDGNDRVRLYTIAFGTDVSTAQQNYLCNCAGESDENSAQVANPASTCDASKKMYFYAPTGDQLQTVFQTIATDLSNLRISH